MADAHTVLMEQQSRRIDRLWKRWEETGEDRWLEAATEADRHYRRLRQAATS